MVPSSEGRESFPEAVPVIAEIPLVLPSLEGRGKLGTTRTTVWFTVEYCQAMSRMKRNEMDLQLGLSRDANLTCTQELLQCAL